jgi:hypothetical protein
MKPINYLFAFAVILETNDKVSAQQNALLPEPPETGEKSLSQKKQLNFFVVTKRKKGKIDPATRFNVLRTKLKGLLKKEKFMSVVARSGEKMSGRILHHLRKHNARIGTIWFDSHGMYKKGYSLFFIGHDEYSYKTLKDSGTRTPLELLAPFADNNTKIVIGSCYGGATYNRASIDYKDTTRMNGDSLMMSVGELLPGAKIYGCESWVMTKPGLFMKRQSVAGAPARKLFRDICYQPAWENISKWNEYDASNKSFRTVNPVTLDKYGNVLLTKRPYNEKKAVKKDIIKNLAKLETGLYK